MTGQRSTLNVSLTPELSDFIASLVRSGNYKSSSEVVREGLRLLQQQTSNLAFTNKNYQVDVEEEG